MNAAAVLFPLVLSGLGGLLAALAIRDLAKRRAMKRWPVTTATVLGFRLRGRGLREPRHVDYQVSFAHEGETRVAWCSSPTKAAFGRSGWPASIEAEAERRHPAGSTAPLRVNPDRPEEAYLTLPEPHVLAMQAGGSALLLLAAAATALPPLLGLGEEEAHLLLFVVAGLVLAGVAVAFAVALFRR